MLVQVAVFSCGVIVRDRISNTLLCDYPKETIISVRRISKRMIRFQLKHKTQAAAIEIADGPIDTVDNFLAALRQININIVDASSEHSNDTERMSCLTLPSLEEKSTKALLLQLLLSDEFEAYVNELQSMLDGLK